MDAKEYALKRKYMCEYYDGECGCCPLGDCYFCTIEDANNDEIDNIISIVENWEEPKSEIYESKKDMITIRDYFEELLTRVEAIEDRLNNLK